MCDALEELSDMSLGLQECDMNLYMANKKTDTVVQHFMKDGWFWNHIKKTPSKLLKICGFKELLFMGKITEIILHSI